MVKALILERMGNIKEVKIRYGSKSTAKNLKKYLDKENKEKLEKLAKWDLENFTLIAFGFKKGNDVNKHELLPTPKEEKYYNDIILLKFENSVVKDITIDEYTKYYNEFYGYYNSDDNDSEKSSFSCDEIEEIDENDDESINYENSLDGESLDEEIFYDFEFKDLNDDVLSDSTDDDIKNYMERSYDSVELEYESYSSDSD